MSDRRLLGRGLGAADLFVVSSYTGLRNVHSGYLLLLIDVGLVGLVLALGYFAWTTVALMRAGTTPARSHYARLYVALLVVFLVSSFAESTFASFAFSTVALWVVHGLAVSGVPLSEGSTSQNVGTNGDGQS